MNDITAFVIVVLVIWVVGEILEGTKKERGGYEHDKFE